MLVPAKTLADAARMMAPGVLVRVMIRGELGSAAARTAAAGGGDALHAAEAMIGFESAGRRLTTRLIAGEYIKYMSRFPDDFGSRGDMPAVPLVEAVKRVALVAERGSSVRLSFGHGKVTIEAGGQTWRDTEIIVVDRNADALKLAGRDAPPAGWEIVPTYDAQCLVAYLMSLDQSHPLKEVKSPAPAPPASPAASPAAGKGTK